MASINGRAPAFLRLPSNGLPNYMGQCGEGRWSLVRACVRACVSFTAADFSAFIERMRGGPLPTRDRSIRLGIAVENRLNPFLSPTVPCKYGLLHVDR